MNKSSTFIDIVLNVTTANSVETKTTRFDNEGTIAPGKSNKNTSKVETIVIPVTVVVVVLVVVIIVVFWFRGRSKGVLIFLKF